VVDDKEKSDVAPKSARKPIKDWPATERPREKLLQLGPEGLSDGELLAVLLRIGKSGQTAEDLGRKLLSQFSGISGIDRAHIEELLAVPGMGIAKTAQLKSAREPACKRHSPRVSMMRRVLPPISDRGLKACARNPF
jgi:DNA repair protein RadC